LRNRYENVFFSSRRRHTRSKRDWSSDVCSSDLDEPLMEIRGAIEGFYGIPWSHRSRLDHFAFYGEHKLNTYIYTPKDDLLLRARSEERRVGKWSMNKRRYDRYQEILNEAKGKMY